MKTALVTRCPEHDGKPGLRWCIIIFDQVNRRARIIRKSDYFGSSIHVWARTRAKQHGANVIAWDSRVILSQRFRGRKAQWHPARQPAA